MTREELLQIHRELKRIGKSKKKMHEYLKVRLTQEAQSILRLFQPQGNFREHSTKHIKDIL